MRTVMLKNESPKISDINYALNVSNAAAQLHIKATYQLFNASAAWLLSVTLMLIVKLNTADSNHSIIEAFASYIIK